MESKKEQKYRSLRERYIHHFAIFGAENITYALYDSSAWSNSVDFIYPYFDKDWNIIRMEAGMLNLVSGEYFERLVFTEKQDFFDFIDEIIAADEKKHPDTPKYHKLMLEKFARFKMYK